MQSRIGVGLAAAAVLLAAGCSGMITLTQFIDVDETLTLFPKMTKREVRSNLGKPVEVRAGLVLGDGTVYEIWLYHVRQKTEQRERLVKPDREFRGDGWAGGLDFAVFFKNDQLVKWGHKGDDWSDLGLAEGDVLGPFPAGSGVVKDEKRGGLPFGK